MGDSGDQTACYFLADPQEPQEIVVEVPSTYAEGRIVFADFSADLPGGGGNLSKRLADSGLPETTAELMIFRGADRNFAERVDDSDEFKQRITDGQPVLTLVGGVDNQKNRTPLLERVAWAPAPTVMPTLEQVRALEMQGLLAARRGILERKGVHYELAGGSHVDRYVRLRDALEVPHDCRRIIDWILPSIEDGSQILIAHRGLGSLQIALEARLRELFDWRVEIHRLPRYDQSQGNDPELPVSMAPDESRKQVVLIGVDTPSRSAGGAGGNREKTLKMSGFGSAKRIRLVDTTYAGPAAEAFVHIPIERRDASKCSLCKGKHSRVDLIDADTEIPAQTTTRRSALQVHKKDIVSNNDFWRFVERTGAARVHYEQPYERPAGHSDVMHRGSDTRHRAVDIDVVMLLESPVFAALCRSQLAQLDFSNELTVLIPEHGGSGALSELAAEAFDPQRTWIHVVPRLEALGSVDLDRVADGSLLLLDDMVVTGETIDGLRGQVKHALGDDHYARLDLHGFSILNCLPSEDSAKRLRNRFTPGAEAPPDKANRPQLSHVRRVPLPPVGDGCPLCEERKRLAGAFRPVLEELAPEFLEARISTLDTTPLVDLCQGGQSRINGSVIGGLSEVTAFVRWASAFQGKRDKLQTPSEGQPPGYHLDIAFIASNWEDGAMCGGMLRTATQAEVRYAGHDAEFAQHWKESVKDMKLNKLLEFGWAAVEGKLNTPSAQLVMNSLRERADQDPAAAALSGLFGVRERADQAVSL